MGTVGTAGWFGEGVIATGSFMGGPGEVLEVFIFEPHQVVHVFNFSDLLLELFNQTCFLQPAMQGEFLVHTRFNAVM